MKLSRIPGHEPTVKHSFSLKKSTSDMLEKYHSLYQRETGVEVPLKDVVEQMLLDFMGEDKTFQKELKKLVGAAEQKPSVRVEENAPPVTQPVALVQQQEAI